MSNLAQEFLEGEHDSSVLQLVSSAIDSRSRTSFEFNTFDVRIDFENQSIVLDDVLDPERSQTLSLDHFRVMLAAELRRRVQPS